MATTSVKTVSTEELPIPLEDLQAEPLDMAELLTAAYELGDMMNASAAVADYQYWKQQMEISVEAKEQVRQFLKAKELFEECQRFGRFHPDYHAAKDKMKEAETRLNGVECVRRFKAAEQELDELLYAVSELIARAVSEDIKVPSNDPGVKSGCGSGGSCGCGSGGCG